MTRAELVVVDASALVSVLFGEPAAEAVVGRLAGTALAAPTLLACEVASACRRKIREHPAERDLLLASLGDFARLPIESYESVPDRLVRLAERSGLTVCDAAYLDLALALDAPLVSLDERLTRAWGSLRYSAENR